ncbi:MAG: serine/threonine-protein kinase, partial [Planctomycetes bacterium]|nr:serine/threonine-protein kinase [Planctomycetota bacterium]
ERHGEGEGPEQDGLLEETRSSAVSVNEGTGFFRSAAAGARSHMPGPASTWSARESEQDEVEWKGELPAGAVVGDFKLLSILGHGGMGQVWEAEQTSMQRRVALKLLHPHFEFADKGLERFEREAQAGGRLTHPGIVQIHSVGAADGRHFMAQELVEGSFTLADVLNEFRQVDEIPESYYGRTAALFVKIGKALQHAHEEGVIHRDIKPSNLLINSDDQPKVADFGLAMMEDQLSLSRTGEFMGTPFYMSPEQAASKRMGIDHRTDIFSLGATLYEALTLIRPFNGDTSQQVFQQILLADPPNPREVRSRVPRDLAVICLKALEKMPEQRYPTMAAFVEDLDRYLNEMPILAKPPTTLQRTVKWIRRHPTKSAAGAVAATAFIAVSGFWWRANQAEAEAATALIEVVKEREATATALEFAQQERDRAVKAEEAAAKERDLAEQRAMELQQVSDFQARQLSDVDVEAIGETIRTMVQGRALAAGERVGRDPAVLAEEGAALEEMLSAADFTGLALGVLDQHVFQRALHESQGLGHQPLVRAQLLQTVANTRRNLGLLERALEPQREALKIRRKQLGNDHAYTLASIHNLALLLCDQGMLNEAEPLTREAVEGYRRTLGEDHPYTLTSTNNLGLLLHDQGKYEEAEEMTWYALERSRSALGDDASITWALIRSLGTLLHAQNKLGDAEPVLAQTLTYDREKLGDENRLTLGSITNLSSVLHAQGKFKEAEPLCREALAGYRKALGDEHPHTLTSINLLAVLLRDKGDLDEAEQLFREAFEARRRKLGESHHETVKARIILDRLLKQKGAGEAETSGD